MSSSLVTVNANAIASLLKWEVYVTKLHRHDDGDNDEDDDDARLITAHSQALVKAISPTN